MNCEYDTEDSVKVCKGCIYCLEEDCEIWDYDPNEEILEDYYNSRF